MQLAERRHGSVEDQTCCHFHLKMIAPLSDGINVMAEQELRPSPQPFVTLATLISERDVCFCFW